MIPHYFKAFDESCSQILATNYKHSLFVCYLE